MKTFFYTKLTIALTAASLLSFSVNALEQPNGDDLIGNYYGGIHLTHAIDGDDGDKGVYNSAMDHASGAGVEIGYRYSPETEFRLSYSHMNWVFDELESYNSGNSYTALDVLYFPNKQNLYFVGGLGIWDIVDEKPSADLGAGYRYYLTQKSALYLEGKGNYQFSDNHLDYSAKLGFIYFFGENKSSGPKIKPQTQSVTKAEAASQTVMKVDTDNDGVFDDYDKCANTPMSDKVDAKGCTVFTEEVSTMELLINFDNNQSTVKAEYFTEVKKAADFLNQYPHTSLTIEGHTSSKGAAAYNKTLSQKRAEAVVDLLINDYGIDASRLSAMGYGEERLINMDDTAQAHADNRRIEAKISVTNKVAIKR
ncbi:OmpA family protein [Colwelliaceae bacterium 6471]